MRESIPDLPGRRHAPLQRTIIAVTPTSDADRLATRPTVPDASPHRSARGETRGATRSETRGATRGDTMMGVGPHAARSARGRTIVGIGPSPFAPADPVAVATGPAETEPAETEPAEIEFQPSAFARGPDLAPPEPIRPPLRGLDAGDWALLAIAAMVLVAMLALLL